VSNSINHYFSDWRSRQKEDLNIAKMQAAAQEFAERTLKRWQQSKQTVDGRTELLFTTLANQTADEYFLFNALENLQKQLTHHGADVNVDQLGTEIKKGDCMLLQVPGEKWISAAAGARLDGSLPLKDFQLVRCVRLVRVMVQAYTTSGMRTLVEEGGDEGIIFPTGKVSISAGDSKDAWALVLRSKLGLPDLWLRQFVSLACCGATTVEVNQSNKYPGLPSWYIVDEVTVKVKIDADQSELRLIGLPNGVGFKSLSRNGNNNRRQWVWLDVKR
jgi:hypothetical protein